MIESSFLACLCKHIYESCDIYSILLERRNEFFNQSLRKPLKWFHFLLLLLLEHDHSIAPNIISASRKKKLWELWNLNCAVSHWMSAWSRAKFRICCRLSFAVEFIIAILFSITLDDLLKIHSRKRLTTAKPKRNNHPSNLYDGNSPMGSHFLCFIKILLPWLRLNFIAVFV